MTSHEWDWTAIVNLQLVERALADQERRARRSMLPVSTVPTVAQDHNEDRPVAA